MPSAGARTPPRVFRDAEYALQFEGAPGCFWDLQILEILGRPNAELAQPNPEFAQNCSHILFYFFPGGATPPQTPHFQSASGLPDLEADWKRGMV